jgi:hypothetical protein
LISKKYFGSPGYRAENMQFEPPTDNETGSTTWPSSDKLDAAAQGAAAVRSAAQDERRSREQSVRAHFLSTVYFRSDS